MFAKRLKELRKEKKLSQQAIANYIGMSVMAYAHYEWGDREPSFATLIKLCTFFGVSSDYLLGMTERH